MANSGNVDDDDAGDSNGYNNDAQWCTIVNLFSLSSHSRKSVV